MNTDDRQDDETVGPWTLDLERRWFTHRDEEGEEWGKRSTLWHRLGIAELLGLEHE